MYIGAADSENRAPGASQAEMEAGTETALRSMSPANVKQSIDALGGAVQGKNVIINGAFNINQRIYVSGAATTAGQYTLDRWKVTGTGGITFSTTANKTTVTIPSGQALQQVVEGLNLQSDTYTLSWEGTAQGKIGAGSLSASPVSGSITGGTNTTIEFAPGTVANVQLEIGSVATPFEHRPYGTELALCQRYYEKGGCLLARNITGSTAITRSSTPFFVPKCVTPSITIALGTVDNISVYSFACYDSIIANGDFSPGEYTATSEL